MNRKSISTLLATQQEQVAAALPAGVDVGRVMRMARTVVSTSDIIATCSPRSVLGAVIECAQLGLEPGITAHLVPHWDYKTKAYQATLIADYRGLMALARRSGQITSIYADVVREGDEFRFTRGTNPTLEHAPKLGSTAPIIAVYAVAHWRDSEETQFEVMAWSEVESVKSASLAKIKKDSAKQYSPWVTSEVEMARKTAIRRLCKYLPSSTEDVDLQRAIILDEAADRGEQRMGSTLDVLDGDVTEVDEPAAVTDEQRAEIAQDIEQARPTE